MCFIISMSCEGTGRENGTGEVLATWVAKAPPLFQSTGESVLRKPPFGGIWKLFCVDLSGSEKLKTRWLLEQFTGPKSRHSEGWNSGLRIKKHAYVCAGAVCFSLEFH